ncbi:S9 family peptidase [Saccharicrinis sp. FJH2]|uniref:S9 family peptidase n=1 Tax=Saccharicrinis sp. FJH65 TaxID=3344659 RepID=UPI0035F232AB
MKHIILFFAILTTLTTYSQTDLQQVELEDFTLRNTFYQKDIKDIHSLNDGQYYTVLENGQQIVKYSYKTGEKIEVVFDVNAELLQDARLRSISGYAFSNDEKLILVYTNKKQIYRRSYTAEYWVYNIRRKRIEAVEPGKRQQMATFSPDGNRIAFARDNNLYLKDLRFGTILQITDDGERNKIINGIPDWVYEEEFEFNKAFEWSPDGQFLAYIKFDESDVKEYSFPVYKGSHPSHDENELYPGQYVYKYPKTGEKNSVVSVHVYNTSNRVTHEMKVTDEKDIYFPRIRWTATSEYLAVLKLNRHQNELELYLANPKSGVCRMIMKDTNDRYIDEINLDYLSFLPDNEHFVFVSEKDGWNHLYLYRNDGTEVRKLTNGKWDLTKYYGFDSKRNLFYYQAAAVSPLQREVYAVDIKAKKVIPVAVQKGTNSADFSADFSYFIKKFSSAQTPRIVSVCDYKGSELRALEDNKALVNRLKKYQTSSKEFFSFKTTEGVSLNGWMIKPVNFDPNVKYPVLMIQYSGPGSQEVLDQWEFGWEQYLTSQGYLVACVDGRGTGARGEEFKKCTYLNLGKLESMDQIEAAKYVGSLPYTDPAKIGIWGWSYGGFMSALCMSRESGVYRMGIAVAPVTHYKFYDSIYTERFMRTYGENPNGFDNNSPLMLADKLEGDLLICHGTADDNVHYQNTIEYAEALVQANKQFEMQVYNNRNHSIYGGNTRNHLYHRMFNFMERTLK